MPPVRSPLPPRKRAAVIVLFLGLAGAVVVLDRGRRDGAPTGEGPPYVLEEVAAARGLEFEHRAAAIDASVQHIQPHIMGVGAAVSAVDFDRDGWLDLYATSSAFGEPNALFRNRGDGSFEDVAAAVGVADLNEPGRGVSMGSIWGDVDNDGYEDLLVYRYGDLALFRNRGGERFEDVTAEAGLERWVNSNAATWIDYDRDGYLDLYVSGYYRAEHDLWNLQTTRIMHDSGEFATNGGNNHLFRNRGDFTFEDVTDRVVGEDAHWTFAVCAADFDADGWQDLYLANDYGSEVLLLNRDGERFERTGAGLAEDSKSGMSVSIGTASNDGRMSLFVSNISSEGYIFHGNNLRENRMTDAGIFRQQARGALVDAGWAWGAQFGDLDLDGWQDLVVVNGFISQDPDKSYWYDASKLSSGVGGILADASHWSPIGDRSQSGYERTRVYWNLEGQRFVDVAEQVGITDRLDGRAVVLVDLENRGLLDLVVANQKGPLLLYRNEPTRDPGERTWIELALEGTRSNRSAIGATVELAFGDYRQIQVVDGGSGFSSQRDRRLHFGLGPGVDTCSAVIRWPSGLRQELPALEPGRLHRLVEPEP